MTASTLVQSSSKRCVAHGVDVLLRRLCLCRREEALLDVARRQLAHVGRVLARRPDPDRAEQQQERVGEDRDEEEALEAERDAEVAAARRAEPVHGHYRRDHRPDRGDHRVCDHAVRCIALNGSASESRNVIAASSAASRRGRQPRAASEVAAARARPFSGGCGSGKLRGGACAARPRAARTCAARSAARSAAVGASTRKFSGELDAHLAFHCRVARMRSSCRRPARGAVVAACAAH